MGYAEKLAELQKLRDDEESKRRKRDEDEMGDELFALASDPKNVFVRVPEAPSHLPGHVVCRLPAPVQVQRFRELMWRDSKERGVVAAKAAAGADLVQQTRLYPSADKYSDLTAAISMLPDKLAEILIKAADGAAVAEGKG